MALMIWLASYNGFSGGIADAAPDIRVPYWGISALETVSWITAKTCNSPSPMAVYWPSGSFRERFFKYSTLRMLRSFEAARSIHVSGKRCFSSRRLFWLYTKLFLWHSKARCTAKPSCELSRLTSWEEVQGSQQCRCQLPWPLYTHRRHFWKV